MDVVWGETAGVEGQLWLLCPILFILQVMKWIFLILHLFFFFLSLVFQETIVTVCVVMLAFV